MQGYGMLRLAAGPTDSVWPGGASGGRCLTQSNRAQQSVGDVDGLEVPEIWENGLGCSRTASSNEVRDPNGEMLSAS